MQLFPIPAFSPPTEFFCILEKVFDDEQIEKVISAAESLQWHQKLNGGGMAPGTIGGGEVNEAIRKSEVLFLEINQETEWIFRHIAHAVGKVNYDKFGMDLDFVEALQFTKYGPTNDHYSDHIDSHQGDVREHHRKLSMTLMLTDPTEYEGGDLVINIHGNPLTSPRIRAKKGDAVFFYSHLPHRVDPVTSGERLSLVSWFLGPKMR